jgi:hypothetical protein
MASFDAELRRDRLAARMSLTGLTYAAYTSKSILSKLENGLVQPSPARARNLLSLADTPGADLPR